MADIFSMVGKALTPIERAVRRRIPDADLPPITRPVIIFGVERSGTTLLYSILANHPDFYWLSRLDSLAPQAPVLATSVRRVLDRSMLPNKPYLAIPKEISRSSGYLPPSECLPYWKAIFRWGNEDDYRVGDDCFSEEDLDAATKQHIHADLQIRLHLLRKSRLLVKQPGFTLKLRYLNALFPDAILLHVVRNPIDNLISLTKAKERSGEKFWGTKIPNWEKYLDSSLEEQGAIQIRDILRIINRDVAELPDQLHRYLVVKYEDILSSPSETIGTILSHCGLPSADAIDMSISEIVTRVPSRQATIRSPLALDIMEDLCYEYGYRWNPDALTLNT